MSPRERLALAFGALAAVAALGWQYGWAPLEVQRARARDQIALDARLLALLNAAPPPSAAGPTSAAPPSSAAPAADPAAIAAAAAAHHLTIDRLSASASRIAVTLDPAPWSDLVAWLATLERDQGLTAARASLTPADGRPGLATLSLELEPR